MRILICDDDTGFSRQLREILITFFRENALKLPEIIIYDSGEELLKDPGSKDIVFLDIEMPGMNGICAGNELKKQNENTSPFSIHPHFKKSFFIAGYPQRSLPSFLFPIRS